MIDGCRRARRGSAQFNGSRLRRKRKRHLMRGTSCLALMRRAASMQANRTMQFEAFPDVEALGLVVDRNAIANPKGEA
jgi:hypothetical protein